MNRRGFVTTLLAAAAATALPAIALDDDIEECLRTGLIEDRHFVLHKPLRIANHGVIIRRCTFEAAPDHRGPMVIIEEAFLIQDCSFTGNGSIGSVGIFYKCSADNTRLEQP